MADPTWTITPVQVADLLAAGERMPVCVHLLERDGVRVLVDTGLTQLHPAVDDMDPRLVPWPDDLHRTSVDHVVNTHLHFDHCGGNHLFAGTPVHVQRAELDDVRTGAVATVPEWVDAPGVEYLPVDGEHELLPGLRLLPAPGHTRGSQVVAVETAEGLAVVVGDTFVWHGQVDEPTTEGQRLVLGLDPVAIWMSHESEPWRPS